MSRARRIEVVQRQAEAMRLRVAGFTLADIARQLGYASESGALKAIMTGLDAARREPADAMRELALRRCERMLQAVWSRVLTGDLDAIDRALRIEARRARLLGLDAQSAIDLTAYVEALAAAAGKDKAEALAEAEAILAHSGRHSARPS